MRNITYTDRLRYQFDNIMSRGTVALVAWLLLLALGLVVIVSIIVVLAGLSPDGNTISFGEALWMSLMREMDAGAVAGDVGPLSFRLAMLAISIGGIFSLSMLIGVLTSGVEGKLEELRKGRSFVVEENHTVILGWSLQIFSIIQELVTANANQGRACITILAPRDKVEMEDEIRDKVGDTGRTRIVCRTGNPIDLTDLEIVNPHAARAIIILAPELPNPDSHVIKTILALTNHPQRRQRPYHIVAELRSPKNMDAARMVGRDEAELVLVSDVISRITVQTSRQSGLSVVYLELLGFEGDEIYFHAEPGLVGKTFGESLTAYEKSALIGLAFKDGSVKVKPPLETRIEAGDQFIAISEDDNTIRLSGLSDLGIEQAALREPLAQSATPERTLILGWNQRAPMIIAELDDYVAPGSEVTVLAENEAAEAAVEQLRSRLQNQTLTLQPGDPTDRPLLNSLNIPGYQHVVVLSASDELDPQEADAQTLITLLHLREIGDQANRSFSLVSEMLDVRNRELAEVTRADDFIVSDRLVSLLLAQIAENKKLAPVFADLLDPEGAELYLKPVGEYVETGRPLNFYTVMEAARRRGEVALGYRLRREVGSNGTHGVHLNPAKSQKVVFEADDRIIVLAES
jgi:voltage-gated potassium channel Kch